MTETNSTLRKSRTKIWRKTAVSITNGDGVSLQQQLQYKFGFKGVLENIVSAKRSTFYTK